MEINVNELPKFPLGYKRWIYKNHPAFEGKKDVRLRASIFHYKYSRKKDFEFIKWCLENYPTWAKLKAAKEMELISLIEKVEAV